MRKVGKGAQAPCPPLRIKKVGRHASLCPPYNGKQRGQVNAGRMSVLAKSAPLKSSVANALSRSVDRTIDDVELRRMSPALAEALKCLERAFRHVCVERHYDNPGSLQQFVEELHGRCSEASRENDLGFQDCYC